MHIFQINFPIRIRVRRFHNVLSPFLIQAIQMLQFSSLLELQAHKLWRDALQVINAAISGLATMNFWNLMENFFGVDEDPSESLMEDAASMVTIMKAHKAEQEKDESSFCFKGGGRGASGYCFHH